MDDKKDGVWIYYLGKKIISKGKYKNGKKIGIWKEYDQSGKFEKEIKYGDAQNK
jgi:antitoxin component YwqK of YwqJK toxin-antitoxin module